MMTESRFIFSFFPSGGAAEYGSRARSDMLRCGDTEKFQTGPEHLPEESAKPEPGLAHFRRALQNRRTLIERGVKLRGLEEVIGENARFVRLGGSHDRAGEFQQLQGRFSAGVATAKPTVPGHAFPRRASSARTASAFSLSEHTRAWAYWR